MEISGCSISLAQLNAVATGNERIELTDESRGRIRKSRAVVEKILEQGQIIYGISTGFGKLSDVKIEPDALRQLQLNLVRSHSCGIGQPLSIPEVRAMIFLRANVLALGFSGVRLEVVEFLCQMLNRGVYPVVPEKGSVGASGDLAPLAHLALALIGEGESFFEKERLASTDALARAGLKPVVLAQKNWDAEKGQAASDLAFRLKLSAGGSLFRVGTHRRRRRRPRGHCFFFFRTRAQG